MRGTEFTRTLDVVIGSRIAALRQAKGISRNTLAKRLNVSHQQVAKYEKGTNRISVSLLLVVADVLNVTMEDLCGKITPETQPESPGKRLALELAKNFLLIPVNQQVSVNAMVRSLVSNKLQVIS